MALTPEGALLYGHGLLISALERSGKRMKGAWRGALFVSGGGGTARTNGLLFKAFQPGARAVLGIVNGATDRRPGRAFALLTPQLQGAHAFIELRSQLVFGEVTSDQRAWCARLALSPPRSIQRDANSRVLLVAPTCDHICPLPR